MNQTGTITELKPAIEVPAACHTTPIYLGHNTTTAGLEQVPWMKAEPPLSGIIGYLFFIGPEASRTRRISRFIQAADIPMALSPAGNYPSIVNVPTSGCWQLQLKSGSITGTVIFWVVGD